MKKIIALALSLMLLLGCVSALAEAADKQTITMLGAFTITTDKLPEGYTVNVIKNSEMEYEALITSPEAGKPNYVLLTIPCRPSASSSPSCSPRSSRVRRVPPPSRSQPPRVLWRRCSQCLASLRLCRSPWWSWPSAPVQ